MSSTAEEGNLIAPAPSPAVAPKSAPANIPVLFDPCQTLLRADNFLLAAVMVFLSFSYGTYRFLSRAGGVSGNGRGREGGDQSEQGEVSHDAYSEDDAELGTPSKRHHAEARHEKAPQNLESRRLGNPESNESDDYSAAAQKVSPSFDGQHRSSEVGSSGEESLSSGESGEKLMGKVKMLAAAPQAGRTEVM
jgi:hypothetical protein